MAERMPKPGHEALELPMDKDGHVDYSGTVTGQREATAEQVSATDKVLIELGFDPSTVGATVQFRREKDKDGNISLQPLTSENVDKLWVKTPLPPRAKAEVEFPYQIPVAAQLHPSKPRHRTLNRKSDKTALIIPDLQAGGRMDANGDFHPFHDRQALEVAYMLARYIQPDLIIYNGDNNDFPSLGKHGADPTVRGTVNYTLQENHNIVAQFATEAPGAVQRVLAGNHDNRLPKYVRQEAPELIGLRQAGMNGHMGQVAMSLDWLMNFGGLRDQGIDVRFLEGYPNNGFWLNDRLQVIHGNTVNSAGSTAAKVINGNPMSSVIFGHVHRIESHYRTSMGSGGKPTQVSAHSFGTLARVDGAVPSYHNSLNYDESPMVHWENWQQGVGLVEYKEGDSPFNVTTIPINTHDGYTAYFDGREFAPNPA